MKNNNTKETIFLFINIISNKSLQKFLPPQDSEGNLGDCTLIPLYDNEDSVCGIIYDDVPYYFNKKLQGDIIEITNKMGSIVARYTYDA